MKFERWLLNSLCAISVLMAIAPKIFERGSPVSLIFTTFVGVAVFVVVNRVVAWICEIHHKVSSLILTERDWRPGEPTMSGFVWGPDNVISGTYVCRSHTKETGHPLSQGAIGDAMRISLGVTGGELRATCVIVRIKDGMVMFAASNEMMSVCQKKAADQLNRRKLVPMSFPLLQHILETTRPEFDQIFDKAKGSSR